MTARMQDKVVLVTGGASGLGRATAERLVREGARVAIGDLNTKAGEQVAAALCATGGRAIFAHHDVTREADWQAAIAATQDQLGPLDALINNAGILIPGDIEHIALADYRKLMQVNAESCFLGCQAGVRAMKERGGAIVNVASVASWLPVVNYAGYSVSKAAVEALTRATALHCRANRIAIRVNSVHPDGIWTPMMEASLPPGVTPQAILFDPQTNPRGRATRPEHIAKVLVFLASDDAHAISGAAIHADSAILGMGL